QRANRLRIQWTHMKHDANTRQRWQAKRSRKSKRMEEGKYPQNAVAIMQVVDLFNLFHVRRQIEMRKHHAFRLSRRSARENHRSRIVNPGRFGDAQKPLQHSRGKQL